MALPQEKLQTQSKSATDVTKEYVVGTGFWSTKIGQILSNFADDLEWIIGPDVYERMSRDPVVSKNLNYQKLAVTSEQIELHPPVDKKDPRYARAIEIKECCERSQNNLHRPINQIIGEMMNALKRSHTVAEITYNDPTPAGPDAYKLTLKSIKVKPHNTTAFVIDPYRNVLGLTAWLYGTQGMVPSAQLANGQRVIDREKFVVLTFETEDEDPRGVNILRTAYNFWAAKCLVPALNLGWLDKSGVPSTVGFTAPNSSYEQRFDRQGNDTGEIQTAEQAMAETLSQGTKGAPMVFPNGASVETLSPSGNGEQFTRAYDDFDKQIDLALSMQSGATQDGKHGSRSAKQVLKDVFDVLIWSRKRRVAETLRNDVWKHFVRYNFGEEDVDLTPIVVIGDEEGKDWAMDAKAAADIGPYLTDSQWDAITLELGIPAREEGEEVPKRVKAVPTPNDPNTLNQESGQNPQDEKK